MFCFIQENNMQKYIKADVLTHAYFYFIKLPLITQKKQLFSQTWVNLLNIIFRMFHQKSFSTSYLHKFKIDR